MRLLLLSTIVISFSVTALAQAQPPSKEDIQKRAQELLKQIEDVRKSLDVTKKNKKETLAQLALIQQKIALRNQLIRNINGQIENIEDDMTTIKHEINQLKKELDTLKEQYAKSIVYAYKNRSNYDMLNFIFSASNFNDALKRITYLQAYRNYRAQQAENIKNTQRILIQKYSSLDVNKARKGEVLQEETIQQKELQVEKTEKNQVITKLQQKEKELAAEIAARERQRLKLRNTLNAIIKRERDEAIRREKKIEEERKKQEAIAKANAAKTKVSTKDSSFKTNIASTVIKKPVKTRIYSVFESTAEGLATSTGFENNRGRLSWPVASGIVVGKQGTHSIEGTHLTETNDGIRIETSVGATVKNVFEGVVTGVFDLEGEFTIIIRHGKYLTTYSNLATVSVTKGQQIKAGQAIGKIAAGLNDSGELTFMISSENSKFLDPLNWLRPR